MFETITKKTHPKEWAIIKMALPNYRKRTATICITSNVELHGRYWNGGSRTTWYILKGGRVEQLPSRNDYPFAAKEMEIDLVKPNDGNGISVMVVSAGTFCGKPAIATLYKND